MDNDDMEGWEADADLFYRKDWQGLIEYRRRNVQREPNCQYTQWSLAEAYVLSGEYEKAIRYLGELHKKYPDDSNIHHSLLEALMAVGKDETAFSWIVTPQVLRLGKDALDFCYSFMRLKRKPKTVEKLYIKCFNAGYPMFNAEQLIQSFQSDTRFILTGDLYDIFNCYIIVRRR